MKHNILTKIFLSVLLVTAIILRPDFSLAALDNTNIVSDYNFSNANPMTAAEINDFLIAKGSRLANYTIPEFIDVPYPLAAGGFGTVSSRQVNDINGAPFYGKTVAQLIYDESTEHNINPRVVLATLQKESSAITGDVFRSSTVATWPMFYMYDETMANCLNSGTNCDDAAYRQRSLDYGGMGRQLGYSIGWFGSRYYSYKNGGRCLGWSGTTCTGGYQQYYDPAIIDGQSIICQTAGSRILYLYTPHIQTSFYNIFSGFFGDPAAGQPPAIDTTTISSNTYAGSVHFSGAKTAESKAYFRDTLIADIDTTTWEVSFEPVLGQNSDTVVFKDADGNQIAAKIIAVNRHKTADIDGDGGVNGTDLSIFASFWGTANPSNAMADLNGDNVVDGTDLSIFAANWNS